MPVAAEYYKLPLTAPHLCLPFCMLETWQETRYTLRTFGLPVDAFPITHDKDDFSLDNHMDWLSWREKLEARCLDSASDKGEEITVPGPLDVVMGRGYDAQVHPGNLRYRNIIAKRQEVYEKSLIHEKTAITKEIVRLVKESGGRFLQQDGHGWMLVDDKKARTKASSAFSHSRRKANWAHRISNAAAKSKSKSTLTVTSSAKANSFIGESSRFATLQHILDEGMINPSDMKRLKIKNYQLVQK
jgi:hypothetical protein